MLGKTVQYKDATIVVGRGTVRSKLRATTLYGKFGVSEEMDMDTFTEIHAFVRFLTQAKIAGDIGFFVPGYGASQADLNTGLDEFLNADGAFYDAVVQALNDVDSEVNSAELLPDVDKKN